MAEMLRRRPAQEPAKNIQDKLGSLGRQCARHGLKTNHFDGLATDMDILLKVFSGAKKVGMPREEVSQLFDKGLTLLNALLNSIDETKLR